MTDTCNSKNGFSEHDDCLLKISVLIMISCTHKISYWKKK